MGSQSNSRGPHEKRRIGDTQRRIRVTREGAEGHSGRGTQPLGKDPPPPPRTDGHHQQRRKDLGQTAPPNRQKDHPADTPVSDGRPPER